jgi:hypothetical protein
MISAGAGDVIGVVGGDVVCINVVCGGDFFTLFNI